MIVSSSSSDWTAGSISGTCSEDGNTITITTGPGYEKMTVRQDYDLDVIIFSRRLESAFDWLDIRKKQEHFYRLKNSRCFNVYKARFNRRAIFSKSGFVGRAGKRLKGK